MVRNSISQRLYKKRLLVFQNELSCKLDCFVHCQAIVSIYLDAFHSYCMRFGKNSISNGLLRKGSRYSVVIISIEKKCLTFESSCKINSCIKISLRACSFSKVGNCYFIFFSIHSESVSEARSLRNLSSKSRRHRIIIMLWTWKVNGHLMTLIPALIIADTRISYLRDFVTPPS